MSVFKDMVKSPLSPGILKLNSQSSSHLTTAASIAISIMTVANTGQEKDSFLFSNHTSLPLECFNDTHSQLRGRTHRKVSCRRAALTEHNSETFPWLIQVEF